jgi:TPR repeat protein
MAMALAKGKGIARDREQANVWFLKAMRRNPLAPHPGVPASATGVREYLDQVRHGSEVGIPEACLRYGMELLRGDRVEDRPGNREQGRDLLNAAADSGVRSARAVISVARETGTPLSVAAQGPFLYARAKACLFGSSRNFTRAVFLLELAVAARDQMAEGKLGELYLVGPHGFPRNVRRGLCYTHLALRAGDRRTAPRLGNYYALSGER